jgi:hypothetical protein
MAVDATTLVTARPRGDRARRLVAEGLADILAGDNHGDTRSVSAGYHSLVEHGGRIQADLLVLSNPRAILDDGELAPVPPFEFRTSLLARVKALFQWEEV